MIKVFEKEFKSIEQLLFSKKLYEDTVYSNYYITKSVLLTKDLYSNDVISNFKYKKVTFSCKRGGKKFKTHSKGVRKSSTQKIGCRSFFSFKMTKVLNSLSLILYQFNETHNHETSEEVYKHMPMQRKLNEAQAAIADTSIGVNCNMRMLQNLLMKEGKVVLLKDLHNLRTTNKINVTKNDLVETLTTLYSEGNGNVDVPIMENEFTGLFYQTKKQQSLFENFPEVLFIDATYKLNTYKFPVFLLLVIDNYGISRIVGTFLVQSENISQVLYFLNSFKKFNPSWTLTQTIISDKSNPNRNAFSIAFPQCKLELCIFHVLQIFKREITTKKRNITQVQSSLVLKLLRSLVYAKSPQNYEDILLNLYNLNLPEVTEYFNINWNIIKEEWSMAYRKSNLNFLNYTNNRLECHNRIFKTIIKKYSSLNEFFKNYILCINSLDTERDHKIIMEMNSHSTQVFLPESAEFLFREILTNYAFNIVYEQMKKKNEVNSFIQIKEDYFMIDHQLLNISITTCSCGFQNAILLPCSHIFKLREYLNILLFDLDLCHHRWRKTNPITTVPNPLEISLQDIPKRNHTLSKNQKFNKFKERCIELAGILCERNDNIFHIYYNHINILKEKAMHSNLPDYQTPVLSTDSISQSPLRSDEDIIEISEDISLTNPNPLKSIENVNDICEEISSINPNARKNIISLNGIFDGGNVENIILPPKFKRSSGYNRIERNNHILNQKRQYTPWDSLKLCVSDPQTISPVNKSLPRVLNFNLFKK